MKTLLCSLMVLAMGCAVTPKAQQGSLPKNTSPEKQIEPKPVAKHEVNAGLQVDMEELKANNEKAGSPSFGFVKSFYRLPVANPVGSVQRITGNALGIPYDSIQLQDTGKKPFALEPINVGQLDAMAIVLNDLLAAGVQLKEITMADAMKVVEAEQNALASGQLFWPNRSLASGADILLTWQSGQGLAGNVIVGRAVRTSDGALLALISTPNIGNLTLRSLVLRLISQSLAVAAAQK